MTQRLTLSTLFISPWLLLCGHVIADDAPASLCEADEKVIFDCIIEGKSKRVSLCARGELANGQGELRYRFGTPEKVELTYPEQPAASLGKFTYSAYLRGGGAANAGLDLFSLIFHNGGFRYEVFSEYSAEDDSNSYGVRISGKQEAELACTAPVTDHLRDTGLEQTLTAEPEASP